VKKHWNIKDGNAKNNDIYYISFYYIRNSLQIILCYNKYFLSILFLMVISCSSYVSLKIIVRLINIFV